LLNLASVYADEERLDEAEALYKRALGIREGVFGPNHLEVAVLLNNLAQIYETQGHYEAVETFSKRALAIVSKTLGPNNPDTAGDGCYRVEEGLLRALKAGPNLIVHFGTRSTQERFAVDYASIPGRWDLMRKMLTPSGPLT
jgi:tetratricopeptide (TPR) repeat protein